MAEYAPRLDEINFTLNQVAGLAGIAKLEGYQHADPETVARILGEAGRFFSEVMSPLNRVGDREGSVLADDGSVHTPEGFKEAYRKFTEAGWAAAHMPEEWGGGGLPYVVGVVIEEMFKTANMAFSLCAMLTHSAVEALVAHGTPEIQGQYLEKLVRGQWTGTMVLTEPEAGSDLGRLQTRAIPQADGTFRLFGTKIFITWGDHDLAENIVHLVLARIPDSPPGTKGISMFLVPKRVPDGSGSPGERNDLRVISLEHKLGIHASPTCVLSLGDEGVGAVGFLLGEANEGMRNMFTMMNVARVGVGMEGIAMAERSYQTALAYARERVQGRPLGADSPEAVPIVAHPDVRRMLLTIKANVEAMRCLLYVTAAEADRHRRGETENERVAAEKRLALLTPVVKAWCTDTGVDMASLGIQIHGGAGYIEETGAAQYYRDARIAPIYEGTNGIQAIDLVLRKLPMDGGAVMAGLLEEMSTTVGGMRDDPELAAFRDHLESAVDELGANSAWLGERLAAGDHEAALAGATPYLRQFGLVSGGWLMARSALAALAGPGEFGPSFLEEKVVTARFYGEQILPKARGLASAVTAGADLLRRAPF